MSFRTAKLMAIVGAASLAAPAMAHDHDHKHGSHDHDTTSADHHHQKPMQGHHGHGGYEGEWQGQWQQDGHHYEGEWRGTYHADANGRLAYSPQQRAWWIAECNRRMSYSDGYGHRDERRGIAGAVIGGALGGLAGNRIAGRGDRTEGTIIGAAVGAAAGAAIGNATERRNDYAGYSASDYCENYLAAYESGAFGRQGYGHHAVMMVPVQMGHTHRSHGHHKGHSKNCKTIVTTEEVWETVPTRHRVIHKPAKRTKYVKPAPVKRTKYIKPAPRKTTKSVKSVK